MPTLHRTTVAEVTHRVEGVVDVVDQLTWQTPDRPDTIPVRSLLF